MITDTLSGWVTGAFGWLLGIIPAPPDTSGVTNSGGLTWLANLLDSVSAWLPLGAIASVLGLWAGCWLAACGVYVGRVVLNLFTGGGGSVYTT